jgi:hypothetical protein
LEDLISSFLEAFDLNYFLMRNSPDMRILGWVRFGMN